MGSYRHTALRLAIRSSRLAVLAVLGLGVGGCFPLSEWRPSESPRQGSVELVQLAHWVDFTPNAQTLSTDERARLDRFLESIDLGYGDSITVGVAGDQTIAQTRARLVQAHLTARRVETHLVAIPAPPPAHRESVAVNVARYVVTPPKCPDWTKNAGQDVFNTPTSNIGCATGYNHALMVANPGDLVHGKRVGPGDGTALALGIERYQKGEIIDLMREEFETREQD
jgi:pilus assembly protein CpaD